MKILYNLEIEDIVVFSQFYIDTSPVVRKQRQRSLVVLALVYGLFIAIFMFTKYALSFTAFCITTYAFFVCWYYRKITLKRVKHMYAGGKAAGLFCEHEIELLSDGIRDATSVNETMIKFAGIERIEITPSHVFIFTSSFSAHVIPKAKVSEGDLDAFISDLKDKMQSSGNCQPILNKSTMER
jgi:hypothetical protein